MLILGIDPGTATTGFGVLEIEKNLIQLIEFGLIETAKETSSALRLKEIFDKSDSLIKRLKPNIVSIERLFFATNAKTAMTVGEALGILKYSAASNGVEIAEYAPGTIKKTVTGDGKADKKSIQKALRSIFGLRIRSKNKQRTHFDNSADALAVALCHVYKTGGDTNWQILK